MTEQSGTIAPFPARPIPESYWVRPGHFLAGQHPGSRSRAEAMDRLRRFLASGITCFVDLTEPDEVASYEALLPFATPAGRRVEYFREPIPDHDVPGNAEVMTRIVALIDDALGNGHVVYVHCRGGIGRSAMAAACWLASKTSDGDAALEEIQSMWQQSSRSRVWSIVPETEEQADFVRDWAAAGRGAAPPQRVTPDDSQDRERGALLGLAIGDLAGAAVAGDPGGWTQHTAMTLCLAESLLSAGRMDARDQMAQYLRWRDEGYLSARGSAAGLTDDVSRALATYQWRGQPMAGSHDPTDLKTSSLPRVVAAVLFAAGDPVAGVALAGECSRTTNQAPVVIDACRFFAALLFGALRGVPAARLFDGLYEPVPGLWRDRPLKDELLAALTGEGVAAIRGRKQEPNVLQALVIVRESVIEAKSIDAAVRAATRVGSTPALTGALAGALAGALLGAKSIPPKRLKELPRLDPIESVLQRLANRAPNAQAAGPSGGPV